MRRPPTAANISASTSKVDAKTAAINAAGEAAIAARIVANTTAGDTVSTKATEAETAVTNANNYVGETGKDATMSRLRLRNHQRLTRLSKPPPRSLMPPPSVSQANARHLYCHVHCDRHHRHHYRHRTAITGLAAMDKTKGIGMTVNALATAASTDFAGLTAIIKTPVLPLDILRAVLVPTAGFTVINSTQAVHAIRSSQIRPHFTTLCR